MSLLSSAAELVDLLDTVEFTVVKWHCALLFNNFSLSVLFLESRYQDNFVHVIIQVVAYS